MSPNKGGKDHAAERAWRLKGLERYTSQKRVTLPVSCETRKTRPLNTPLQVPSLPPVVEWPTPPLMPSSLTSEQEKFLLCCGFFLREAKEHNREAELQALIEGRFFGEWPVPLGKDMAGTVTNIRHEIRRELSWAAVSVRAILPPSSWELVMAMPIPDIVLHMTPCIAEYQKAQKRLGLDMPEIRAHHFDIFDRATELQDATSLLLSGDGVIDLTPEVDEDLFMDASGSV